MTVGRDPLQPGVTSATVGVTGTIASLDALLRTTKARSRCTNGDRAGASGNRSPSRGVLARRYPETPAISYIPAVAWAQRLRLAAITNDESLREKVGEQTGRGSRGEKPLFGDRMQLTAVAGTMIFAELAAGPA